MVYSENSLFDRQWAMVRAAKTFCSRYTALCRQSLAPLGLTAAQSEILLYLYQRPCEIVENRELLNLLQITPASLSNTLKELEQKGFIRCSAHGREKKVSLTIRALEIHGRLTNQLVELEAVAYYQVTESERNNAQSTLEKIVRNLSDYSEKIL